MNLLTSTKTQQEIRTLTSSLGWTEDDVYVTSSDCIYSVEALENLLLEEDVFTRNIRLQLSQTQLIENDLIPILLHSKDVKLRTAVVRFLANLTLPVECVFPPTILKLTTNVSNTVSQLYSFLLKSATAFLHMASTALIVNNLRDEMLKSERFQLPLTETRCEHLKNCLLLLRNILHCPDIKNDSAAIVVVKESFTEWESVQSKLVWNLFVQGLDGALLLMLNSKYKAHWTIPMAEIITLLYRNQSISRVQRSLEQVSSTSESAEDDEESDGSKNSSASLSSGPNQNLSNQMDSGCPQSSDDFNTNISTDEVKNVNLDIFKKSLDSYEDEEGYDSEMDVRFKIFNLHDTDEDIRMGSASDYSSSCEGMNACNSDVSEKAHVDKNNVSWQKFSNTDVVESKEISMSECVERISTSKKRSSSDENHKNAKIISRNIKSQHKHRNSHVEEDIEESDSSMYSKRNNKAKSRVHTQVTWKGKACTSRKTLGCAPSVCLDAAINVSHERFKYPLWEKKNSISALLDENSNSPTEEEIGNLLKNFTLCFLHSGFQNLILDLKTLLTRNLPSDFDKTNFFWLLSYFMHFGKTFHLNLRHICNIISLDMIGYLTYESVLSCEEIEMHIISNQPIPTTVISRPHLLVAALKEIITTIHVYSSKTNHPKDRQFFRKLCCDIAENHQLRQLPLLLLQAYHSSYHTKQYLQDIVIFNHYLLLLIERGSENCWQPKRMNIYSHLKQFASQNIVQNYGRVLEDFKTNSSFINDCVFTMMHHLAGDINSPQLLMQPNILKTFSNILREDMELEQFWEDLVMYILNKFSRSVGKHYERKNEEDDEGCSDVCNCEKSSSNSSNSSNSVFLDRGHNDDELFWWYLQFELDKDPVSRIAEHIPASKEEILQKLRSKRIITEEKFEEVKKLFQVDDTNIVHSNSEEMEHFSNADDEITHILRKLVQSGHHQHITWLQDQLLETCFIKIGLSNHTPEPVILCCCQMTLNIPIIPYTDDQKAILQDETFLHLLRKLGFFLGADVCKLYPRIPVFWTAEMLHSVASRLGPIKNEKLKFISQELQGFGPCNMATENDTVKQENNNLPQNECYKPRDPS